MSRDESRRVHRFSEEDMRRQVRAYVRTHWGEQGTFDHKVLAYPDPRSGPPVVMGRLVSVVYETEKRGDGESHYEHEFEGPLPYLVFNASGLFIAGGRYRVTTHGIEG